MKLLGWWPAGRPADWATVKEIPLISAKITLFHRHNLLLLLLSAGQLYLSRAPLPSSPLLVLSLPVFNLRLLGSSSATRQRYQRCSCRRHRYFCTKPFNHYSFVLIYLSTAALLPLLPPSLSLSLSHLHLHLNLDLHLHRKLHFTTESGR